MLLTDTSGLLDTHLDPSSAAPVLVAYSGGGDSLAVLVAAGDWARRCGRNVVALHVDHQLQPHSGAWAETARRTAHRLGAGFRLLSWVGPKPRTGLPQAARTARLGLLAQACRDLGGRVLLFGHTADDVAEADWMRRQGSALGRMRAWSASPVWPQGRGVFHLRPVLRVRRCELREALVAGGLSWIDDPANQDPAYARARARMALAGEPPSPPTAPHVRASDLHAPGPALAGVGVTADGFGAVEIDQTSLRRQARHESRAILSRALTCAAGGQAPPRGRKLDGLLERVFQEAPIVATLGGAKVDSRNGRVVISRDAGRIGPGLDLTPGEAQVWDGRFLMRALAPGWRIEALAGHASRLPADERRRLRAAPAAIRPTLPLAVKDWETVTCPILAHGPVKARSLAAARLGAAMGAVQTESQAMALAHGEEGSEDLSSGSMCS